MTKEELVHLADGLQSQVTQMQSQVTQMQFQIDQMNRLLYGAKRERFISNVDENQLSLPFDVPEDEDPEKEKETITYVREKKKRKEHPGRVATLSCGIAIRQQCSCTENPTDLRATTLESST